MKYYQAKVNQSAKIICSRLEAANQVYDQIQKLEENPLYLNHNRIQDLTKEFQDQIDKPLGILNQIALIKEDEFYLDIEGYYFFNWKWILINQDEKLHSSFGNWKRNLLILEKIVSNFVT